jgi:DNA polymerase III subunit gamma/tau
MFYSQYRPQKFRELINSDHIVTTITKALLAGKPAHAYFFTGSRGVGKTTTARLLAKALNCEKPLINDELKKTNAPATVHYEPCGICKNCIGVEKGSHLDLIEIDAASNRGIDNIRELRENVKLSPSSGKYKIYIIDEVHMLTTDASNALLKTLEEPPAHAFFILCTTNPEKVIETIKSRCVVFHFNRPAVKEIVTKLKKIAEDQDISITEEKLSMIATSAKGAFREAETLLEQMVSGEEYFDKLINRNEEDYYAFSILLIKKDVTESINFIHQVYLSGVNLETWTENLIQYLRRLMLVKAGIKGLQGINEVLENEIDLLKLINVNELKTVIKIFASSISEYGSTVVPTLPLELAVIESVEGLGGVDIKKLTGSKEPESNNIKNDINKPIKNETKKEDNKKNDEIKEPKKQNEKNIDKEELKLKNEGSASDFSASENKKTEGIKETEGKDDLSKVTNDESFQVSETKRENQNFPYSVLIETIKPKNHSIHVMLRACDILHFDGENLRLQAYYSFHKERIMSRAIRTTIEDIASGIAGRKIVVDCVLSDKKPNAKSLTDQNIKNLTKSSAEEDVADALEKIFGDEIVSL